MRERQTPSDPGFAGSSSPASGGGETTGRLAENILYFARALRAAGIPVGPGAVLDALEALQTAGVGTREDFYWTLHAVFVKRHEHTILFDQAFRIFFRRRGYIDQLIAMMMPQAPAAAPQAPQAGATRVHEALYSGLDDKLKKEREIELDARLTVSDREVLQKKDFAHAASGAACARSSHRHPPHLARQHERRRRFHRSAFHRAENQAAADRGAPRHLRLDEPV
jgi:uncharacterized protein with von Willebrand factor type A (vWA) domain